MRKFVLSLVAIVALSVSAHAADAIRVVGSSTVYPFTTAVAEQFAKKTGAQTPVVESTGTGGGIKLFCAGAGADTPSAVNASRPIKPDEDETCKKNGVTHTEITIGLDAIVLAMSKDDPSMTLSTQMIYDALAKHLYVDGKWIDNPHKTWKDIDSALPGNKIEVLGPPPTSGTRDSFVELVMEKSCKAVLKEHNLKLSVDDEKKYCKSIRDDGAFVEAGENDNLIVQKLVANPNAYGIFGFSFLEQNSNAVQGVTINDVKPTYENIAGGKYPISRELYVYFKNEHFESVPELKAFMEEYQSKDAIGEEGYLADKGLVPLK
jgi:phosphate transport system substrate-binding protein